LLNSGLIGIRKTRIDIVEKMFPPQKNTFLVATFGGFSTYNSVVVTLTVESLEASGGSDEARGLCIGNTESLIDWVTPLQTFCVFFCVLKFRTKGKSHLS
jgi:hypothetical protein